MEGGTDGGRAGGGEILGHRGGDDGTTSWQNLLSDFLHENLDQKKPPRHEREDGERGKKVKLEKTAEGVNNSCRQYDFFM